MLPIYRSLLILSAASLCSCDKVKDMAGGLSDKLSDKLEDRLEEPEKEVSPWQVLVDQNEEGVVFRKDLPFPSQVKVITKSRRKINARIFHESELEKKVDTVNGQEDITVVFDRMGSSIGYTIKETSFVLPSTGGEGEASSKIDNPFRSAPPASKTLTFKNQGGAWKGNGKGDFKLMALSQQLSPVFGQMAADNGLLPRSLWFSPSRVKIGDEIKLSAGLLPMVIGGKPKGSLKMKLVELDEVKGHPCGVFEVSGEYSRSNFPDLEGKLMDQEVTVETGRIWLSLIHPMVLKEKMKTIQTFKPSAGGSVISRAQGTIEYVIEREWQSPLPEVASEEEPVEAGQES